MKIASLSTVTQSGIIRHSKAFAMLLIGCTVHTNAMTTETVDITIERPNGQNVDICRNYPLDKLIALSNFGDTVGVQRSDAKYYFMVPIASGNIFLDEGDIVRIEFKNLITTRSYDVYAVESGVSADQVYQFIEKVFVADEKTKRFDVDQYDLVVVENADQIIEVQLNYNNGQVTKHELPELLAMQQDVDNVAFFDSAGNAFFLYKDDTVILPLVGVKSFEMTKSAGQTVRLYFMDNNE